MRNKPTPLTDEFLQSVQGIRQAETDPFFYTRLKARMEKRQEESISLALKPAWLLSLLAIFLFINTFFLMQQSKQKATTTSRDTALQNFAGSYDLTIFNSF